MISARRFLLAGIFICSLAWAEKEKRWPAGADEFATSISVPAGFAGLMWEAPAIAAAGKAAPLMLEARFRSTDAKAEFATPHPTAGIAAPGRGRRQHAGAVGRSEHAADDCRVARLAKQGSRR